MATITVVVDHQIVILEIGSTLKYYMMQLNKIKCVNDIIETIQLFLYKEMQKYWKHLSHDWITHATYELIKHTDDPTHACGRP